MRKNIIIFIFATTAIILLVDIYFLAHGDSISQVIRDYSYQVPAIPFAFGFLIGHWYGTKKQ